MGKNYNKYTFELRFTKTKISGFMADRRKNSKTNKSDEVRNGKDSMLRTGVDVFVE